MPDAPARPAAAGTPAPPRSNAVVAVLALAGIVVSLMQTLVIPIVPELPKLLDAPASDTAWAVTATLLAAAVATPVVGRLGDMVGKRRMLLTSIVLLISGSVVCALADSLIPMITGRALQGLSAAVVPLGISILRDTVSAEKLAGSTAVMSASLGVGGALGLPTAAFIADNWDWHILFWTSAALGVVAFVLVLLVVPESENRVGGRFDLVGSLGLSAGLVSLLLAVSKGGDWGWTSATTLGLGGAAVLILLAWGRWELRAKQPLVDLRTTAKRQVLFTNLASIALGFSMFAMSLVLPQLLQLPEQTGYGLGRSMLTVGLVLAPQGLVMMVMSAVSAGITKAKGPKVTLMIGSLIVATGYGLNIVLMSEVWHLVLVSCVIGAGCRLHLRRPARPDHGRGRPVPDRLGQQPQHPDAVPGHQLRQCRRRGDPRPDDHRVRRFRPPRRERLQGRHGHRRGCGPGRLPARRLHPEARGGRHGGSGPGRSAGGHARQGVTDCPTGGRPRCCPWARCRPSPGCPRRAAPRSR